MSKTDIRLLYQKASGHHLDHINEAAEYNSYVKWLEEELELALSVGERLLISHNLLLGNEESEPGQ